MDTFDWTNMSQYTCPSDKKDNFIIYNNIKKLLFYYKTWWRRGGTNLLLFCRTPYLSLNPLWIVVLYLQMRG